MPAAAGFKPIDLDGHCKDAISLYLKEYEAIRSCDCGMKTRQEASVPMGVSRPTLSWIYVSARQKIAKALVRGVTIMIEDGATHINSEWPRCGVRGSLFNNANPTLEIRKVECLVCHSDDLSAGNADINKNKIMTKIAIPARDNVASNHFGHCEYCIILTVRQNDQILSSETIPFLQGCGCKPNIAGELENMGVGVMPAENTGQGASNVLMSYHTKVIRGCLGSLSEAVADYLSGRFTDLGVGCLSHEHHHECHGHSYKE